MKYKNICIEKDIINEIVNEFVPVSGLPNQQIYIEGQRLLLNAIIQYIFYVYPSDKHTVSHCLHMLDSENINQKFLTLSQYHPARISYENFLEQALIKKKDENGNLIEEDSLYKQIIISLDITLKSNELKVINTKS